MKIFYLNSWSRAGVVATAVLLHACAPSQDAPAPTAGLDVSRYLAVGDSYTAGFSAGGLTRASQEYSFPNQLARQLRLAAPEAGFSQPLLEAGSGSGYTALVDFTPAGFARSRRVAGQAVRRQVINPAACGGADTVRLLTRSATASALPQNLGVPRLLLSQLETTGLGNEANATPGAAFNPYFERLLPAADSRSYLQVVTAAAPSSTFFTYFQGLDDVLPFVRSGGQCGGLDVTANRVSLVTSMKNNSKKILDRLTANGQRGIIATLPDLTTLPLLRLGKGEALKARLRAAFNDTADIYISESVPPGQSPFPAQRLTDDDYVLATALVRIGQRTPVQVGTTTLMLPYGRDIRNPLRDEDVLDSQELSFAKNVLGQYNTELERLASVVYKLPIVTPSKKASTLNLDDFLFSQVAKGISVAGVNYSIEPAGGNVFSLDYVSLTPRGNALLANVFIAALNRAYRSSIPTIDVNSLPSTAQ